MEQTKTETLEISDLKPEKGTKRILKNFSFLTLGKLAGNFFYFILFVIISRKFGQEGIGQYSFAMGFTGFFSILSGFGLYNYSIKEISRNKESISYHFQKIFSLNVVQSFLMLAGLLFVVPFLSFSMETKIILVLIGSFQIFYTIIDILTTTFIAVEQMHLAGIIAVTTKLVTSTGAILAALLGGNIILALSFLPLTAAIQLLIVFTLIKKKFGKIKFQFSLNVLQNTLKNSLPFGISELLDQFLSRLDVVLIGFLIGEAAAGIYNVGYRVIFVLLFIPFFASVSVLPVVSSLFRESRSEFQKLYNKILSIILIIGMPVSAGLLLIAPKLTYLIFGASFSRSAFILRILAGVFLLKCFSYFMNIFLISSDKQKDAAHSMWIVTIISMVIFPILITLLNIEGAAIAVLSSSILLVILFLGKLKKVIGFPELRTKFFISFLGVCSFLIPLSFFSELNLFITTILSALIYIGVISLFEDIRRNELFQFLNLIKNKSIN